MGPGGAHGDRGPPSSILSNDLINEVMLVRRLDVESCIGGRESGPLVWDAADLCERSKSPT